MKKLIASIALIACSGYSHAQYYAGVDGGYGFVDIKAKQTAQTLANLSGSTVKYTYDKAALSGRFFLGMDVAENLAVELGYFMSANASATYTISGASATENYSTSGFDAGLVFKPSANGLFLKAGFHRSEVSGDASVKIGNTTYNIAANSKSGTGLVAGIGYEAQFNNTPDMKWRMGWSHYNKVGGVSDANVNLLYIGLLKKF